MLRLYEWCKHTHARSQIFHRLVVLILWRDGSGMDFAHRKQHAHTSKQAVKDVERAGIYHLSISKFQPLPAVFDNKRLDRAIKPSPAQAGGILIYGLRYLHFDEHGNLSHGAKGLCVAASSHRRMMLKLCLKKKSSGI